MDEATCEWLMEHGGETIRYRVAKDLLYRKSDGLLLLRNELLQNPEVKRWLAHLHLPVQGRDMLHGSTDDHFENALLKAIQLGLHAGIHELDDVAACYLAFLEDSEKQSGPKRGKLRFGSILVANLLFGAGYRTPFLMQYMRASLAELYGFVSRKNYDLYVGEAERSRYKGIPSVWMEKPLIKPEIFDMAGYAYPLIYDLIGLCGLYELKENSIHHQIDAVIAYVACDAFHDAVADGYGILAAGPKKYYSMGWDPKFPGWHHLAKAMEESRIHMPRLLFSALYISKYQAATQTVWYHELLDYLETYQTKEGTYCFPKEWLKEKEGYAVLGAHVSFGENRKKKNWCEIESTLYMQLLKKNA